MALRRLFSICEIMSEQDELLKEENGVGARAGFAFARTPKTRELFDAVAFE